MLSLIKRNILGLMAVMLLALSACSGTQKAHAEEPAGAEAEMAQASESAKDTPPWEKLPNADERAIYEQSYDCPGATKFANEVASWPLAPATPENPNPFTSEDGNKYVEVHVGPERAFSAAVIHHVEGEEKTPSMIVIYAAAGGQAMMMDYYIVKNFQDGVFDADTPDSEIGKVATGEYFCVVGTQ